MTMIRRKKLLMKIKTCAMVTVLALACTNAFAFTDGYTNQSYNGAYRVNGNRWIGSLYITVNGNAVMGSIYGDFITGWIYDDGEIYFHRNSSANQDWYGKILDDDVIAGYFVDGEGKFYPWAASRL
jgi:hypothetical protein